MKPGKKPFTSKVCPVCGIEKPRSDYYKKGETVSHKCKPCSLAELKARAPQYFGKYSEYQNAWRRDKYNSDPAYKTKIVEAKRERLQRLNDEINRKRRERWASDPHCPARKYYRSKDVKNKTPKWVDLDEILEFYANCPKGMHVDHIIPLNGLIDGRPVSGLHVPWNLQYLTPEENRRKYNRVTERELKQIC